MKKSILLFVLLFYLLPFIHFRLVYQLHYWLHVYQIISSFHYYITDTVLEIFLSKLGTKKKRKKN